IFVPTTFTTLDSYVCDTVSNIKFALQVDKATISWDGSGVKYKVIWKGLTATKWDTLETVNKTLTLSGLTEGTQYMVSISSQCSDKPNDQSVFTQARTFRTLYITCHVPADFKTVLVEWNLAAFSFKAHEDAQGVELMIYEQGATSGNTYQYGRAKDTISIVGLTPKTVYFAKLRSNCGGADVSDYTDSITFTTPAIPPCTPPTDLKSTVDEKSKTAQLSWAGTGHIAWNLAYKEGSVDWDTIRVNTAAHLLKSLKVNTPYLWKVQGFCSKYLASQYSASATFQVKTNIEDEFSVNNFKVYTQKQQIHILNPQAKHIDRLEIFNLQGALLQSHIINANSNIILPVALDNALVLINLYSKGHVYTYKMIIQ
ncbi:MAG: hypothetical protein RR256_01625, partial [Bacteroidales bacterium]